MCLCIIREGVNGRNALKRKKEESKKMLSFNMEDDEEEDDDINGGETKELSDCKYSIIIFVFVGCCDLLLW